MVNASKSQLKKPQEKGGRPLFVGLAVSDQDEHVQVAAYLLVKSVGQGFTYCPPLYPWLPTPGSSPNPCPLALII